MDPAPMTHVVLIDGSLASLEPGRRSAIGRIAALLAGPRLRVHYAPGQQWLRWRDLADLAAGRVVPEHIVEAYGWLASRWRPGDRVFLDDLGQEIMLSSVDPSEESADLYDLEGYTDDGAPVSVQMEATANVEMSMADELAS